MRLKFSVVLIRLGLIFLISLIVEYDDTTGFISQSDIVAGGVVAYAGDDVLVEDALPWSFVSEYL
jgi:hypothetical protein